MKLADGKLQPVGRKASSEPACDHSGGARGATLPKSRKPFVRIMHGRSSSAAQPASDSICAKRNGMLSERSTAERRHGGGRTGAAGPFRRGLAELERGSTALQKLSAMWPKTVVVFGRRVRREDPRPRFARAHQTTLPERRSKVVLPKFEDEGEI
jgi:hypothetical protein